MTPGLTPDLLARLHRQSTATAWRVPLDTFGQALESSMARAFAGQDATARDVEQYAAALHLDDLALACACAAGDEEAWRHFIETYRPVLYRTADALEPGGGARDLADALYGDLFGLGGRDGARQSLFRYFHGRSSLATWLRAVLSQRHVDRHRERRRTEPLPDEESAGRPIAPAATPHPDRTRFLLLMRTALAWALARLTPPDRCRLACYYAQQMTLAQVGRLLGEHEATVSRNVARTRRERRQAVEHYLKDDARLGDAAIDECFRSVAEDAGDLDLVELLGAVHDTAGPRKESPAGRSTRGTP